MTYHIKDMEISAEEFSDLRQCVGEYRRIVRDQTHNNNEYANNKLKIANSLILFLDEIEWKNKNAK